MSPGHRPAERLPVTIAAARQEDLPRILELERDGFPAVQRWSERSWQGELLAADRIVLLARAEHPAGVIAWSQVGELADLHRLVVAPVYHRRGVGTALVRAGLRTVQRLGARAAILEVGYTNEAAIALYQRSGFEQLTARQDYYGPGRHALILKLYDIDRLDLDHPVLDHPVLEGER